MAEHFPTFLRAEQERDRKQAEWDAAHGIDKRVHPPAQHAFAEIDLHGFLTADLPPPRYVVDTLIPAGTVTLLGGHGGSGKSLIALTIAAHVAAGEPWAGFAVNTGFAAFVSLEDPASLVLHRLRRIATVYDLPSDAITSNLRILDGSDGDAALGAEQAEFGVRRFVPTARFDHLRGLVQGARLIVIDNASDAADFSENDRRMVRAFIRILAALARENDAGVLLLAHVDKAAARYGAAGNSYSGSTAWHNSARSRLALAEADGGLELRQEKLNIGRLADPVRLTWSQHGVLVPAGIGAVGADGGDDDAVAVLSALRDATARNVSIPTARTGPSTAHRALETLDVLPRHLRGADGRERFWRALNLLQRSGCASSEEFRNRDRKIRTRIVVVEDAPIGAPANPPYPLLNRRSAGAAGAPVCASYETGAEPAQTGAACPRCAGEGCAFCSTHRPPTPQED